MTDDGRDVFEHLRLLFSPHPWHGVSIGDEAPERVTVYIEIVPSDTLKYEIDKVSGYLRVDRPQQYSNICPSLYGFIPQTYCAEAVAARTREATGRSSVTGDGDPLDVCVLSQDTFSHGNFIANAYPIGGFRMIDGDEADDKILAVLEGDVAYGAWRSLDDVPGPHLERLKHYFLTYKMPPGADENRVEITEIYDREEALEVIERSRADYQAHYPRLAEQLLEALRPALQAPETES